MEYKLRKAGIQDIPRLALCRVMQLDDEESHPDRDILPAVTRWFQKNMESGDLYQAVIEADGVIAATGGLVSLPMPPSFFRPAGRTGYILNMYTRPEYRRRGLATRVLEALKQEALRRGMERLILSTSDQGEEVYLRFGFTFADCWMQLPLSPEPPAAQPADPDAPFFEDEHVRVRRLRESDAAILSREETLQGWSPTLEKHLSRFRDSRAGKCVSLLAEYDGEPAGYVSVYPRPDWTPAAFRGLPEIVDFAVLEKYRRRGVGARLMDAAEKLAGQYADRVFLGVGLHAGYGSAQRMYVRRGYIPDGAGVYFRNQICTPYTPCENDDDLVLFLSKDLQ